MYNTIEILPIYLVLLSDKRIDISIGKYLH